MNPDDLDAMDGRLLKATLDNLLGVVHNELQTLL
jgi:hypothetical protein